jgi:hypothetical protein
MEVVKGIRYMQYLAFFGLGREFFFPERIKGSGDAADGRLRHK